MEERGREVTPPLGECNPSATGGFTTVREKKLQKLSHMWTDLNETWQEHSLGQARQLETSSFATRHQRAELLSVKGDNFGDLAIFRGFWTSLRGMLVLVAPRGV